MLRLLLAALALFAMPAQAAQIFTITLNGTFSGSYGDDPIEPYDDTFKLTGSWEDGFDSVFLNCTTPGCLKASFAGDSLLIESAPDSLPCYCTETITLNFAKPFTGDLRDFTADNFLGGTYSAWGGALSLDGTIFSASVPEPATWAMMFIGFGLLGGALRRQQQWLRQSA